MTVILSEVTLLGNKTALPKLTTAPVWKFDPVIDKMNESDRAGTELGDNEAINGVSVGEYSGTTNVSAWDMPPPG